MSGVSAGSTSFSPLDGASHCAADAHSNNTINHNKSTCYDSASWFSQLVFGWLSPLLKLGNAKGQLDMADLQSHLPLPEQDTALHVNQCFTQAWRREQEKSRAAATTTATRRSSPPPSLAKAMWMVRQTSHTYTLMIKPARMQRTFLMFRCNLLSTLLL